MNYPEKDDSWWGKTRDHIAWAIATFAFDHIATPWYSAMIEGSVRLGIDAARREERESRSVKLTFGGKDHDEI